MADEPLETVKKTETTQLTGRARSLANLKPFQKGHRGGGRPKGVSARVRLQQMVLKPMSFLFPDSANQHADNKLFQKKIIDVLHEKLLRENIKPEGRVDIQAVKVIHDACDGPLPTRLEGANGGPIQIESVQSLHLLILKIPVLTLCDGTQVKTADVIEALGMAQITLDFPALPAPQAEEKKDV